MQDQPLLYHDLAEWFTTLTPPEDYEEEAALFHQLFHMHSQKTVKTVLELGAGAGNNASHLKQHYQMTLTDISPSMIAESQKQNPECDHYVGDMRTIRLEKQFDAVFIHDAIVYMTTLEDLTAALISASIHCTPDGVVLVVPDYVRETFTPSTTHDGGDHPKSMRYLEWIWQPDQSDSMYYVDFAYLLRDGLETRCVYDRHTCGLFSKDEWLGAFHKAGLTVEITQSTIEGYAGTFQPIFIARKELTG